MKHTGPILGILIFVFHSTIWGQEPAEMESPIDAPQYLSHYNPPEFESSDRKEKIGSLSALVDSVFFRFAEREKIPGFAYGLIEGDTLLFGNANGFIDRGKKTLASLDSKFHIASMTKSITAMAILKLRDGGKLQLTDAASQYVPEMEHPGYLTKDAPAISIDNLMTMTSGLPEDNPWADRQLDDTDQQLLDLLKSGLSFSNVPNLSYEYSNLGFAVLGTIISRVSGMPYQEYIDREVLRPLGMTDTYWDYSEVPQSELAQGYRWEDGHHKLEPMLHTGAYGAIGGLITSMADFSKYVSYHLSAWPPRSEPERGPLKRSSIRDMHQIKFPRLYASAKNENGEPCPFMTGYGYGLGVRSDCHSTLRLAHTGGLPGFGSNYVFYPEYGIGIAFFCNLTYTSGFSASVEALDLILKKSGLEPRKIMVSQILRERQSQTVQLIKNWETALETKILAENFYLDRSRKHRMEDIRRIMSKVGAIEAIDPIVPENQLRGTFRIQGEKANARVFFSLTPESVPKVQAMDVWIVEEEED